MVYKSGTDESGTADQPTLKHAIRTMPRWKWRLLGVALVLGCLGVAGQVVSYMRPPTPVATGQPAHAPVSSGRSATPSGSSGFVTGQPADSTPDQQTTPQSQPVSPGMSQILTPFMSKVGFSLFVGVIVGVIFRTFLKAALGITALIIAGTGALSYYHVFNIDPSVVKEGTAHATSWLTDQGYHLRDMLFSALPSSTSATIGFFLGLKRR